MTTGLPSMALRGIFAPMVPFELTMVTSKDGTCLPAQPLMVMAAFEVARRVVLVFINAVRSKPWRVRRSLRQDEVNVRWRRTYVGLDLWPRDDVVLLGRGEGLLGLFAVEHADLALDVDLRQGLPRRAHGGAHVAARTA